MALRFPRLPSAATSAGALANCLLGLAAGLWIAEALLRALALPQFEPAPSPPCVKDPPVILCLGDSFTYGVGAAPGQSYPDRLQSLLDRSGKRFTVLRRGFPGENSYGLRLKLAEALDQDCPSQVVLLAGVNNTDLFRPNSYLRANGGFRDRFQADEFFAGSRVYALLRAAFPVPPPPRRASWEPKVPAPPATLARIQAARALQQAGRLAVAEAGLRRALRESPGDPEALYAMGLFHIQAHGRAADAVRWLSDARGRSPEDLRIRLDLARALHRAGKPAESLNELRFIIGKDPGAAHLAVLLRRGLPERPDETGLGRMTAYDLERMAAAARRRKIPVILMTYGDDPETWYNRAIADAARRSGAPLVRNTDLTDTPEGRAKYASADGHLNSSGYSRVAENLFRILETDIMTP